MLINSGGSRKKIFFWGGAGPSSFGRQQWLNEITTELINSASSRTKHVMYRTCNDVLHWPTNCTILH